MFYSFRQNYSGGYYLYDPDKGISVNVCIEALDLSHAIERAREIGLYFPDDERASSDCPCCGYRWIGYAIETVTPRFEASICMPDENIQTFVHYLNGKITPYYEDDND